MAQLGYKYFNIKYDNLKFKLCFYYYENTTLQDLLEYIAYNYQQYNFCLCFRFKEYENKRKKLKEISNNILSDVYLTVYNPRGTCSCNPTTKGNIKKSKKEIFDILLKEKEKEKKILKQNYRKKKKKL